MVGETWTLLGVSVKTAVRRAERNMRRREKMMAPSGMAFGST